MNGVIEMPLETETKFFDVNRAQWVADGHEGKWAVVRDSKLLDFYDSLETGYEAGMAAFKPGTFLLKQVTLKDDVETIQRAYWGASGRQRAI